MDIALAVIKISVSLGLYSNKIADYPLFHGGFAFSAIEFTEGRQVCASRMALKECISGQDKRQYKKRCQKWWRPQKPHPGTRSHHYRCSLPGLAGFAV